MATHPARLPSIDRPAEPRAAKTVEQAQPYPLWSRLLMAAGAATVLSAAILDIAWLLS